MRLCVLAWQVAASAHTAALKLFHEQLLGRRDAAALEQQLEASMAKALQTRQTANLAGGRASRVAGRARGQASRALGRGRGQASRVVGRGRMQASWRDCLRRLLWHACSPCCMPLRACHYTRWLGAHIRLYASLKVP